MAYIRAGAWFALGAFLSVAGAIDSDGGLMFGGAALMLTGMSYLLATVREEVMR